MKFEKVPMTNFSIKIELNSKEARELLQDLEVAEDKFDLYQSVEEFLKQLRLLL